MDVNIREPSVNVYRDMKWLPLHLRRQLHLSSYMYKIINGLAPPVFTNKFAYISGGSRDAEMCNLYIPKSKSHKCFSYLGAKCWNSTPTTIRTAESLRLRWNPLRWGRGEAYTRREERVRYEEPPYSRHWVLPCLGSLLSTYRDSFFF